MPQTSITFTTDSDVLAAYVQAACALYRYPATVADPNNPGQQMDNPQTPAEFGRQCVVQFCKDCVVAYQAQQAAEAARQAALQAAQQAVSVPITVTVS